MARKIRATFGPIRTILTIQAKFGPSQQQWSRGSRVLLEVPQIVHHIKKSLKSRIVIKFKIKAMVYEIYYKSFK